MKWFRHALRKVIWKRNVSVIVSTFQTEWNLSTEMFMTPLNCFLLDKSTFSIRFCSQVNFGYIFAEETTEKQNFQEKMVSM